MGMIENFKNGAAAAALMVVTATSAVAENQGNAPQADQDLAMQIQESIIISNAATERNCVALQREIENQPEELAGFSAYMSFSKATGPIPEIGTCRIDKDGAPYASILGKTVTGYASPESEGEKPAPLFKAPEFTL